MTTWRGCKRKILATKRAYGCFWYKINIGANMTHWIKAAPFTIDFSQIQQRAMMRGNILLVGT